MSADGSAAGAAAPASGTSILTSNLPPPPPPPAPGTAEAQVQETKDGPPEWAPAKFWDPQTKQVRTEELGKGYKNLEQLLGREKIPMPVGDDDTEGWERVYKAVGRPEKPEEYEFKRPDKLPDGLPYDEDMEKEFRTWAHINGLNKKQAQNFYDGFVKRQIDRHSAWHTHQTQAKSQVEMDMRREFGAQYEGKLAVAKAALSKYADSDYLRYLDESGLGNDPRTIRAWVRIGDEMAGVQKLKGTAQTEVAPADLDKAISEFRVKHKDALYTKDHPDHDRLVKEYNRLFEMRFPEPGVR